MNPLVSVLMPVHNVAPYIKESITSILAQTMEDFELLIVDDHSTDATRDMIRTFQDPRIRIINNPGRGITAALNTGLNATRGTFIARMDGDDISMPRRFAMQIQCLERHTETGICSSQVTCFPREKLSKWYLWYEDMLNHWLTHEDILKNALIDSPLPHPTWMVRKEVFDRVGPYREGPFPEDYDWLMRAFRMGVRAAKVPRMLVKWRERESRASRQDRRYDMAGHLRVKAEHVAKSIGKNRKIVIMGGGRTAANLITALKNYGVTPTGVVDVNPGRVGGRMCGVRVSDIRDFSWYPDQVVLVAIRNKAGTAMVAKGLVKMGMREGTDFFVTA